MKVGKTYCLQKGMDLLICGLAVLWLHTKVLCLSQKWATQLTIRVQSFAEWSHFLIRAHTKTIWEKILSQPDVGRWAKNSLSVEWLKLPTEDVGSSLVDNRVVLEKKFWKQSKASCFLVYKEKGRWIRPFPSQQTTAESHLARTSKCASAQANEDWELFGSKATVC